jgi:nucleoid DNA-binding protein
MKKPASFGYRDIVEALKYKHGLTVRESERVASAFLEEIVKALSRGQRVFFQGFGSFEVWSHAPCEGPGLAPRPEEERVEVVFRPGKMLAAAVARTRKRVTTPPASPPAADGAGGPP